MRPDVGRRQRGSFRRPGTERGGGGQRFALCDPQNLVKISNLAR
jgi:hypothetical protein